MLTAKLSGLGLLVVAALGLAALPGLAEDAKPAPSAAPAPAPATAPAPAPAPAAAAPSPAGQPAAGSAWNAEVSAGNQGITLDEAQLKVVKSVSDYFNGLTSLKGSFVQTTSDQKKMKGKFSLLRPGKFRFDYALPSKQIIISDGEFLAIQDLDLKNEDRVALDQTPFRLLLRKDVDLARDAKIMEVQQAEDLMVVALQDKSPDTPGRIKVFLSTKPAVELKEWVTTDAQGVETRVEIASVTRDQKLDPVDFKIQGINNNPLQMPH
jgi:outer membrane lipoprotein-sorting protein